MQKDQSELLIALIPHIIRRPEITAENLKGIAVGNQTVVKLSYGPRASDQPAPQTQPPAAEATPPAPAPAVVANPPDSLTNGMRVAVESASTTTQKGS